MAIVRDMAAALENGQSLTDILENMTLSMKHDSALKNEEEGNQDTSVRKYIFDGMVLRRSTQI